MSEPTSPQTPLKTWDVALADRIQQLADAGCKSLSCVQILGLIAFVRDGEAATLPRLSDEATKSAPVRAGSLPSGESDPSVMPDCAGADTRSSDETAEPSEIEKLRSVFEAAYGLCMGYDWNSGTAAKACGYRRMLLSTVNAIKEVPDFEDKYRGPSTHSRPDRGGGE